jgi:RimJ/RimL family protein N-acetyltransferase
METERLLETSRLLLRRFRAGDWEDLHEYLSDAEVVLYEPYCVFSPEESRSEAVRRAGDRDYWAVCLKDGGKLIGNLYLARQEFETFELGFVFNKKYQGQGYVTESAGALVGYAFKDLEARRVIAMCNPINIKSWHVLERLGMRREGHMRRNVYFKTDPSGRPVWVDTYLYAILEDEWQATCGGVQPGRGAGK